MELIDTHSHLYDEAYDEDFDQVVDRAVDAGIVACIMPGIDSTCHGRMISVADRLDEFALPCIGLHPTSVSDNWKEELAFVREHVYERRFYAIGEIGLDEYWSKDYIREQIRVFSSQIELASKLSLPILIHAREATEDIFKVLDDTRGLDIRGIFHAYSGSYETYRRLQTYGEFKFGIGGVVTYKKAGIADVVTRMSPYDIVLETDAPWLTPVPYRGKRNESSYLRIIADKVACLTSLSVDAVAQRTTDNARKLFGIQI